jgi:hypothetical protein
MVRNRTRKTSIGSTSVDVMEPAAHDVVSCEKSLNEAALQYQVLTLFRYVAKLRKSGDLASVSYRPHYDSSRLT